MVKTMAAMAVFQVSILLCIGLRVCLCKQTCINVETMKTNNWNQYVPQHNKQYYIMTMYNKHILVMLY